MGKIMDKWQAVARRWDLTLPAVERLRMLLGRGASGSLREFLIIRRDQKVRQLPQAVHNGRETEAQKLAATVVVYEELITLVDEIETLWQSLGTDDSPED